MTAEAKSTDRRTPKKSRLDVPFAYSCYQINKDTLARVQMKIMVVFNDPEISNGNANGETRGKPRLYQKKWSIFGATAFAILLGYKTFDFSFVFPKHRFVDSAVRAILGIHREWSRRVGSVAMFLICFLNFFSSPDLTISTAGGRSIFFRNGWYCLFFQKINAPALFRIIRHARAARRLA